MTKSRKDMTHRRIIETAGACFRRRGLSGIGIADLMKEAGLTHGGFYAHFASKDALVVEALRLASERFRHDGIIRRPQRWHDKSFTLRAPAARPPCGDLCFVWEGTPAALKAMLDQAGAKVIEGPGPRQGGRRKTGSSVYVRDPDGNLLEFMIYS